MKHVYEFNLVKGAIDSIVPICAIETDGSLVAQGTAFCISAGEYFATAKHVLEDSGERELVVIQKVGMCGRIRSIDAVNSSSKSDVAVFRLGSLADKAATLPGLLGLATMNDGADIGEPCATFAYPRMTISDVRELEDNWAGQHLNLVVTLHAGYVTDFYPEGCGITPGPCFATTLNTEGGCSGGPVFNSNGFVAGIHSTGYEEIAYSRFTPIDALFDLDIASADADSIVNVRDLLIVPPKRDERIRAARCRKLAGPDVVGLRRTPTKDE